MASKLVDMHRLARNEASAAWRRYRRIDKQLGDRFADELERTLSVVERQPDLFAPDGQGTRKRLLKDFPFQVVYVELPDIWLIVAVAHVRRRPYYWRRRLNKP